MSKPFLWPTLLGLALSLVALPLAPALAGEAEKKEAAPAKEGEKAAAPEKPAGLVGTVIAVVPASRTLVVDVPLGKDVLRIGAEVMDQTKIRADGKAASFESLRPGARVRINFLRVATGDEAISVEVLRGGKS